MRTLPMIVSALAAVAVAGCGPTVAHVAGDAAPVTPASSTAPAAGGPSTTAAPVLGPNGLGPLKLGMTRAKASATGLITKWTRFEASSPCYLAHLKGYPADSSFVYYSPSRGLLNITAPKGIRTAQGIEVGSSTSDMLRAYPDWTNVETESPTTEGRGWAGVSGNSDAVFEISTGNGKVDQIILQWRDHDCYE